MSTTVFDLASTLYPLDASRRGARAFKEGTVPFITDGLTPTRPPAVEGLRVYTPEELLTLEIPAVEVNGRVLGYQRPFVPSHARKIARAMIAGTPFPPIIVALNGKGQMAITEGQHRALGAVIARKAITVVVERLSTEEQRQLFAGQRRALPVDPSVLILAGEDPFSLYIQDACATNSNAWSQIVSSNSHSKTRITPNMMMGALVRYVANAEGVGTLTEHQAKQWDQALADELAPMVACFGDKKTNPLAFSHMNFRAIGSAAMWVFRRNEHRVEDHERWINHMAKFPFDRFVFIRHYGRMTDELLQHWNKRLSAGRRVTR